MSTRLVTGDVVLINNPSEGIGVVRHIDEINLIVGIELTDPLGTSDGVRNGQRLFQCRPKYGIFVTAHNIARLVSPEELLHKIVVLNRALATKHNIIQKTNKTVNTLEHELNESKQKFESLQLLHSQEIQQLQTQLMNFKNKHKHCTHTKNKSLSHSDQHLPIDLMRELTDHPPMKINKRHSHHITAHSPHHINKHAYSKTAMGVSPIYDVLDDSDDADLDNADANMHMSSSPIKACALAEANSVEIEDGTAFADYLDDSSISVSTKVNQIKTRESRTQSPQQTTDIDEESSSSDDDSVDDNTPRHKPQRSYDTDSSSDDLLNSKQLLPSRRVSMRNGHNGIHNNGNMNGHNHNRKKSDWLGAYVKQNHLYGPEVITSDQIRNKNDLIHNAISRYKDELEISLQKRQREGLNMSHKFNKHMANGENNSGSLDEITPRSSHSSTSQNHSNHNRKHSRHVSSHSRHQSNSHKHKRTNSNLDEAVMKLRREIEENKIANADLENDHLSDDNFEKMVHQYRSTRRTGARGSQSEPTSPRSYVNEFQFGANAAHGHRSQGLKSRVNGGSNIYGNGDGLVSIRTPTTALLQRKSQKHLLKRKNSNRTILNMPSKSPWIQKRKAFLDQMDQKLEIAKSKFAIRHPPMGQPDLISPQSVDSNISQESLKSTASAAQINRPQFQHFHSKPLVRNPNRKRGMSHNQSGLMSGSQTTTPKQGGNQHIHSFTSWMNGQKPFKFKPSMNVKKNKSLDDDKPLDVSTLQMAVPKFGVRPRMSISLPASPTHHITQSLPTFESLDIDDDDRRHHAFDSPYYQHRRSTVKRNDVGDDDDSGGGGVDDVDEVDDDEAGADYDDGDSDDDGHQHDVLDDDFDEDYGQENAVNGDDVGGVTDDSTHSGVTSPSSGAGLAGGDDELTNENKHYARQQSKKIKYKQTNAMRRRRLMRARKKKRPTVHSNVQFLNREGTGNSNRSNSSNSSDGNDGNYFVHGIHSNRNGGSGGSDDTDEVDVESVDDDDEDEFNGKLMNDDDGNGNGVGNGDNEEDNDDEYMDPEQYNYYEKKKRDSKTNLFSKEDFEDEFNSILK